MTGVSIFGSVLCAGVAAWVLCGRDEALRRAGGLLLADGGQSRGVPPLRGLEARGQALLESFRSRFGWRLGREVLCLPAGLALAVLAQSVLPVLAGAAAVPLAGRRLRDREERMAA